MNRLRQGLAVSVVAGALLAVAIVGPVAAVAPENAGCVGQFASTGGTTDGADFGALIRGAAKFRHPFGASTVSYEAHSPDRADCAFTYPPG